jgi:hypothetical protein
MTTHAGPNTQHVNRSDDEQHDEHLSDASDEDQWDKYDDDLWWGNLGVLLSCPVLEEGSRLRRFIELFSVSVVYMGHFPVCELNPCRFFDRARFYHLGHRRREHREMRKDNGA